MSGLDSCDPARGFTAKSNGGVGGDSDSLRMLWPRKLLILQKAQTVTFALKAEARYISGTSRVHTLASTSRSGSENQRKVFSKSIKTTLSGI